MVPKGLQLKKSACIGDVSAEFLRNWKDTLGKAEFELIRLLRAEVKRKRDEKLKQWDAKWVSLNAEFDKHVVTSLKERLKREETRTKEKLADRRRKKMDGLKDGLRQQRRRLSRRTLQGLCNRMEEVERFNRLTTTGTRQERRVGEYETRMMGLERQQQNWERKQKRQERLVEEVALADQSNDDHARYFVSDNVVNLSKTAAFLRLYTI